MPPFRVRRGLDWGSFYYMIFKRENFIVIQGFAVTDLKLSGNELICYSLIYGFAQDSDNPCRCSLTYIASALNVTKQNAKAIIGRLINKGLIVKNDRTINGVKYCEYLANMAVTETATPPVTKTATGVIETATPPVIVSATPPVAVSATNNIIRMDKNKITYNIAEQTNLHGDAKDKGRKTLFRNSEVFALADVEDGDYSKFEAQFKGKEYEDIDLVYYFHSVADWSDISNTKRTERGWLATIRNFIRSDIERGRLHRLTTSKQQEPTFDFAGAAEFLKM